jgi:CDP-ribitol ribitolphosphotransferase
LYKVPVKKFGYQTIGYEDGLNPKTAKLLRMHYNYDYVISGSVAMNKYFSEAFNVPIEKMVPIGTPVCDYLLNGNDKVVNKLYKKYPQLKKKVNVLYSPTFRSDDRDNTEEVIEKFNTDKFNLILTFHPKNSEVKTNKNIICIDRNEFMTFDVLRVVDYVITDYSALAIDACVLNKKVILYLYDYEQYKKENGINIDLFKELEGNVYKNFDDIVKLLDKNAYNEKSYKSFRKKYSGEIDGNSTSKLIKLIKECL